MNELKASCKVCGESTPWNMPETDDSYCMDCHEDLLEEKQKQHIKQLEAQVSALQSIIENGNEQMFLIHVLADIRQVTGIGNKPMLSELAQVIGEKFSELKTHVDNLESRNDELRDALKGCIDRLRTEGFGLFEGLNKAIEIMKLKEGM